MYLWFYRWWLLAGSLRSNRNSSFPSRISVQNEVSRWRTTPLHHNHNNNNHHNNNHITGWRHKRRYRKYIQLQVFCNTKRVSFGRPHSSRERNDFVRYEVDDFLSFVVVGVALCSCESFSVQKKKEELSYGRTDALAADRWESKRCGWGFDSRSSFGNHLR